MSGTTTRARSAFHIGDVVLTDTGRQGVYYGDGDGTYGSVVFLDERAPTVLALPWNSLRATDLWHCWCDGGRFWRVATSPALVCPDCGASRLALGGAPPRT